MTTNIINCYMQATQDELNAGRLWYPEAAGFSRGLCEAYGIENVVAAGIISALSVQKEWGINKRIADLWFQGIRNTHTRQQLNKCHAIEQVCSYVKTISILGGMKTQNFYRNIIDPTDRNSCTIDRHALSVAFGEPTYACTDKMYRLVKQAYIDVARELYILPNECQATCWVTYKRLKKETV